MTAIPIGHAGDQSGQAAPTLERVMGPWLLLLFIIGDVLGTGIYALTGQVAKQVGGAVWLPFVVAFLVALITAFSYLELVTKYPKAGGAAFYTHKAFGLHFVTLLVAFAVMCSGLTSASTAARAFSANMVQAFGLDLARGIGITLLGVAFMAVVGAVNLRGVGESVKANVVLTCIELSGLLIIIFIGMSAIAAGQGDVSRVLEIKTSGDGAWFWPVIAATTLAFFAMVGFEDSVNMAEEAKEPSRIFPKVLLAGLAITGVIYVLVSIAAITLVPAEQLAEGDTPLLKVVEAGAPSFPVGVFAFITMFAVANTALINMLMASRLVYGMGREGVLPAAFGLVHPGRRTPYVAIIFTTLLAFTLITFVGAIPALGGTTALLLLCVFVVVNIAVLVLRRDRVGHEHFRTPTFLPVVGGLSCAFLAGPWTGRDPVQYEIAGILMAIGIVLWFVTRLLDRGSVSDPLPPAPETIGNARARGLTPVKMGRNAMIQDIEITVEDGVQVIRFLRAEKKNAFTGPMYNAMSEALDAAEGNDAIAVHVFIGSGGVFSAGNDINDFLRRAEAAASGDGIPAPSLDFIRRLPEVTKPMIAAVDGLAIGVGTTMLLHCDLVYATPTASLRTPFLDLGLVQEAGSSITAPRRMGYPRAFELICLGEPFGAERALEAGIINAIVPADQLEATALAAARRLAAKPRQALMTSRRLLRRDQAEISAAIDEEAKAYQGLMRSPEAREAFTAFLEKRPPDFAKARRDG